MKVPLEEKETRTPFRGSPGRVAAVKDSGISKLSHASDRSSVESLTWIPSRFFEQILRLSDQTIFAVQNGQGVASTFTTIACLCLSHVLGTEAYTAASWNSLVSFLFSFF